MKTNNEQYRNFNKNLLVYMAGEMPTVKVDFDADSKEAKEQKSQMVEGVEYLITEEPITKKEFDKFKEDLKKRVHLDSDMKNPSKEEVKLRDEIGKHIDEQFDSLQTSYYERIKIVGQGNEAAEKAVRALNNAAGTLAIKMEFYVMKKGLDSGNYEVQKQAENRVVEILDAITVPGFGRYFLKANLKENQGAFKAFLDDPILNDPDSNFDDIEKKLLAMLNNKENLDKTVDAMFGSMPRFDRPDNEDKKVQEKEKADVNEFTRLIDESINNADSQKNIDLAITRKLGLGKNDKRKNELVNVLARRFDVKFDKKGDVVHYADLMDNGKKVYTPDEIVDHLQEICDDEYDTPDKVSEYNKKLDEESEKFWAMNYELKEGYVWKKDDELTGLASLKGNKTLSRVIDMLNQYEEAASAPEREVQSQLAVLDGIKKPEDKEADKAIQTKVDALKKTVRDKFKDNEWMRGEILADLVAFFNGLINKKDTTKIDESSEAIKRGENPKEKMEEANKLYKEAMEARLKKDPKPTIPELIGAAKDKDTKYFELKGEGAEDKNKLMANYKSQRLEAINTYLRKETNISDITMDSEGKMTATINGVAFNVSNVSMDDKATKITFYKEDKAITTTLDTFDGKLAQLKDTLGKVKKDYENFKKNEKYITALDDPSLKFQGEPSKKPSKLGLLVDALPVADNDPDYPTWEKAKKEAGLEAKWIDIQTKLDNNRIAFIKNHINAYKNILDEDKEVAELMKTEDTTAKTADTEIAGLQFTEEKIEKKES